MPNDIDSLKQERAELVDKAKSVYQQDEVTDEDRQRFDRMMDEAESLREQITEEENRRERLRREEEALEERAERISADPADSRSPSKEEMREIEYKEKRAAVKWAANAPLSEEDREHLYPNPPRRGDVLPRADSPEEAFQQWRNEQRASQMQTGSSAAGGTFVPPGFMREIIETQKAYGGLENVARTIQTPMGNDMDIPTVDDTGNQGSIVGEASTIGATTSVPTGNVTLESVKYQSGPIKFSLEAEQDSFTDMDSFLRDKLGARLGRVFASHVAQRSSTESNGPHGITNISTGAVSISQGTTTLDPAALRELIHSVDPAYRGRGSVAFLLNDATLKNFAKLEDADGRPLWQPSLQQGVPDEILGYPVQVDQNIPSMSSTEPNATKPVFFGDMNAYAVRRVMDMRMFRLNERYIEEGNFGLIAFQRADGRPLFHSTSAPAQKPIRAILATT